MASTGDPVRTSRWRRRARRAGIGAAIAVALFALVGFLIVPPIARRVAEKELGRLLGRKVSIARIRINPFALSLAVEDLRVFEPDQVTPFFGFWRLYVNAQLSSAFRRAPVVKEIALQSLRLHVVRTRATPDAWADVQASYNFSDIVSRLARLAELPRRPEPPRPADAAPPRFSLNNIHVDDAALFFDDRPTGDHHEITALAIGVPFVSTLPVYLDSFVEPGLSVRIDGTPFAIQGRTKPFTDSLETVLELRLRALDLTRYVPFVPMRLPFLVDSARLSLALDVGFVRPRQSVPRLTIKGDIAVEKLDVKEKRASGPAPLAALDTLSVRIGDSDLTALNIHLNEILVSGLDVHVRRQRDGTLNVQHLAPDSGSGSDPARAPAPAPLPLRFALDRFTLEKTVIHLRDEAVSPPFEAEVRDIAVSVRNLSNAPGATARVAVGLRAVPGGTVRQDGTLRLTPLGARGKVTIEGIEPGRFASYYRDLLAFDVGSGRLRLGGSYVFEPGRARETRARETIEVSDAFVEVDGLALRRRGARDDFFRLPALAVHGAKVDLVAHSASVAEIVTQGGRLRAARDARGVVDLSTLVATPASAAAGAPPSGASAAGARPVVRAGAATPGTASQAQAAAPAWTVSVARFDLDRWSVRFDDRAVTPGAVLTLDPIALHVTDLSTAPGAKLGLDLRLGINKTGRFQVTGTSTLPPVAATLRFDLRALEILPLQPYFRDQVNLTVTGGSVGLKGQVAMKMTVGPAPPQINASADLDVADLATVDRERQEPLLRWKSFHVGGARFASAPMAFSIGDVGLSDFRARLIMAADGRLNLVDALAAPGAPRGAAAPTPASARPASAAGAAPAAAAPMAISIAQVKLEGGEITFSDRSVRPAYTAELTDLGGQVSGLSSVAGSTAAVDIHGAVNRSGALTIVGKTNPLAKDLALDVVVDVRDVELPPASPYTGKYAGYGISKGKLDLSLAYKIADRKLDAHNKLVLDQFAFGDKVDSPDAVKLPVRLAVALLKDRRGVIDIELPIAGSLDDPRFRIWPAILKVLGNLVVKAVTAPFSLLASAFGGGDELSRIDFAPGTSSLDATAQKRLGTLGQALRERPGISFEIEGGADPAQDRDGLRRFLYERKLKARKLAALVQAGSAVTSLDDLGIDTPERPALLEAAFKRETFPPPKAGQPTPPVEKNPTPARMEQLLLANTRVDDDDLRSLALRRATAVQSALARAVPGGASRLFLITPRLGGPGGHVEFKLKKD